MKSGLIVLVLLLCGHVMAQDVRSARATYAVNGVLIGLADLSPLMNCKVIALEGKVKKVKNKGGIVSFTLKEHDDKLTFQFPLNILGSSEQYTFQKHFLHNGLRLRANGYACKGEEFPLDAISVERVY